MRTWGILAVVLVLDGGCGPSVGDDAGSGGSTEAGDDATATGGSGGATASAASTEGAGSTALDESSAGMSVDCDAIAEEECSAYEECETVSGVALMATEVPGQYVCSDIKEPFACTVGGCDEVEAIICKIGEPGVAVWVVGDCIPAGWEVCEAAMCV